MVWGLCSATLGWMGSVIFWSTELIFFKRPRVSWMWYSCRRDRTGSLCHCRAAALGVYPQLVPDGHTPPRWHGLGTASQARPGRPSSHPGS